MSWLRRLGLADPVRLLCVFAVGVVVAYTSSVVVFIWNNSYFFGDDYSAFLMARQGPFPLTLLAPLGGQVVPFHRALTFLSWRLAPMSYGVALSILVGLHVVAVVYLYRTLQLMKRTRLNVLITAFYATHALIGPNLMWFSSGMTRFPYLAFTFIALFHYLSYCHTYRARHLVVVAVCFLLSLGFFSKTILLPLYCIGLELSARYVREEGVQSQPSRRGAARWFVLAALLVVGMAYVPLVRQVMDEPARRMNTDVAFQLGFLRDTWKVYGSSLLDRVIDIESPQGSHLVLLVWIAAVAYSTFRVRRVAVAWGVGAASISSSLLLVGISNRTVFFGSFMVFEYRHYFELGVVAAPFLGLVVHRLRVSAPELQWAAAPPRRAAACLVVAVVLATHAVFAYRAYAGVATKHYTDARMSRAYMRTLTAELSTLGVEKDPRASFVDDWIPPYLDRMYFDGRKLSELFSIMGVEAAFHPRGANVYRVDDYGHVSRERPAAGRP